MSHSILYTHKGYKAFSRNCVVFLTLQSILSIVIQVLFSNNQTNIIRDVFYIIQSVIFLIFVIYLYIKEHRPPKLDKEIDIIAVNAMKSNLNRFLRKFLGSIVWIYMVVICIFFYVLSILSNIHIVQYIIAPFISLLYKLTSLKLVKFEHFKTVSLGSRSRIFKYFMFKSVLIYVIMLVNPSNKNRCSNEIINNVLGYIISNSGSKLAVIIVYKICNSCCGAFKLSYFIGDELVDDLCELLFAMTMSRLHPMAMPICLVGFLFNRYVIDNL